MFIIFPKKSVDIVDFVRIFIYILKHKAHETLYLTIALIDLFKDISETVNLSSTLSFFDLTAYFCEVYIKNLYIHL